MRNHSRKPKTESCGKITWSAQYPYQVDYCDHFETPFQAYQDIAPIMDELLSVKHCPRTSDAHISTLPTGMKAPPDPILDGHRKKTRAKIRIYDPYYCNGASACILRDLGYTPVHEKRDFYEDIRRNEVPPHDILVTNPPYSDQNKQVSSTIGQGEEKEGYLKYLD
jgi:hypothetical protein